MPNKEYKRLQLRRSSKNSINAQLLLEGEPVFFTDTGALAIRMPDGTMSEFITAAQVNAAIAGVNENISNMSAGVDGWRLTNDGKVQLTSGSVAVGNPIPVGSGGGIPFNGGKVIAENGKNKLYHTQDGVIVPSIDPIEIPASGNGNQTASNSTMTMSIPSDRYFAVAANADTAIVVVDWGSVNNTTNNPTGPGTLEILVNGTVKKVMSIPQGVNNINTKPYLVTGENRVTMRITDSDENVASRSCTINCEALILTWNLDSTMENTGTLSVQLTPIGSATKTIIIKVDGVQYSSDDVNFSNRIFTKNITNLSNGAHIIEAYATMTISGTTITSSTLKSAVAQGSGSTPIIAALFPDSAEKYTAFTFPYRVVAPEGSTIHLYANDTLVDTLEANHTERLWNYRPTQAGSLKLGIGVSVPNQSGEETKIEKTITVSSLTSATEVDDGSLAFKMDPSTITNLENFLNNGCGVTLSNNFDHINGGLQTDADGVRYIRIMAGDRMTVNYPLFAGDALQNGKEFKIIYRVDNSSSKTAECISCMYSDIGFEAQANNIYLYGSSNTLEMSVHEGEKTELDVNIQNRSGQRLMMMWEHCSTFAFKQYSENEEFTHGTARGIVFGSDDADVCVYLIRAYNRGLTDDEMKSNFVFDGKNAAEILDRQQRNDIYNKDGSIKFSEAVRLNPDVHFINLHTKDLPIKTKTTKVKRVMSVEHFYGAGGAYHQWDATGQWIWQGTSTIENIPFAGGNFDLEMSEIRLKNNATVNINGVDTNVLEDGYAMNGLENSIPVKKLTYKKNVTEQSNIINKMCGEMYHRFQTAIRQARVEDPRVRDCMESVMCVVFITNDNTVESGISLNIGPDCTIEENGVPIVNEAVAPGETIFYGLGNLCSNKDSANVFDYDPIVIEVGNNDDPLVLFKSNDLTSAKFDDNFEFRYLDETQFTEQEAIALFKSEVVDFVYETDWTCAPNPATPLPQITTIGGIAYTDDTTAYRKAKWKAEAPNHFVMDSLYWHHNFTLFMLLRDNRAKNMFWSRNADGKWGLWFNWDNDTGLCKNNKGKRDIEPGYLDTDIKGTSYIFNGATNALFSNLRECNFNELRANYINAESRGAWDYDFLKNYCDTHQNMICESLWIEDAKHNAIRVLTNLNNSDYLEKAHGKLQLHIHKALTFQKVLVDSYYNSSAATDDSASFRGYTPSEWSGVEPNPIFTITPYTDMFINLHAGSKDYRVRAYGGQPVQIDLSESLNAGETVTLNDAEIYIRSAGWIQSLGDMSALYLGDFTASKLVRVQTVKIGSDVPGYTNTIFTGFSGTSFGSLKKLRELNMGGLVNAKNDYNFSQNIYLEKLYTKGSGITEITLANGGKIKELRLNAVGTLFMRNLHHITVFDMAYTNLKRLFVLNSPSVPVQTICENATALERIYAKGVSFDLPNSSLLMKLVSLNGYNDSGQPTDSPVVSGTAELDGMSNYCRGIVKAAFPSLDLTVYAILGSYTVRFMLDQNTQYGASQTVEEGGSAVKPAVNPASSISAASISEFAGWNGSYNNITQNTDVMASWIARTRYYTVKWLDLNGHILQSQKIGYGSAVAYEGADLASTADYLWTGFDWKSWAYAAENLIDDNTEELTVLATYDAIERPPIRDMSNYDYVCSDDYQDNAAYTLGELAAICRDHVAQDYGLDVGDLCRLLTIENRTIPDVEIIVRLECFHGSRLSTGGEKDAPHEGGDYSDFANITWGMIGTLTNPRAMASSNTNVGGYDATTMKNYLNNEVFPNLRPGWHSLIKSVQFWTTKGNSSTEMVRSDVKLRLYNAAETNLWQTEPYLSELDSQRYRHSQSYAGFPYYQNSNLRIKKTLNGAGSAQWYWVGSPAFGSASAFCAVHGYGTEITYVATNSNAVSCCFST